MSLRRTIAVARKEGRHILRDSRSLAMALAVPILMLLLFGLALSLDVDHIPTLIYDADRTSASRDLIATESITTSSVVPPAPWLGRRSDRRVRA